jgi:hypothetical protein
LGNLDALLDATLTPTGRLCVIGRNLADLPDPYKTALRELITGTASGLVVAARMKSAGLGGSEKSVQIHRRGLCGCPTEGTA